MANWLCGCGARNALGLLRCPRCGELSPQFAVAAPVAVKVQPPARRPGRPRKVQAV